MRLGVQLLGPSPSSTMWGKPLAINLSEMRTEQHLLPEAGSEEYTS